MRRSPPAPRLVRRAPALDRASAASLACATRQRQAGMTLVELIISIVIIGIAVAALYTAMASITGRSADPMLRQQSLALAEAYLEAISVRPYAELSTAAQSEQQARDINGNEILPGYSVAVAVEDVELNGLAAKRIDVMVKDPSGQQLRIAGYRTDY